LEFNSSKPGSGIRDAGSGTAGVDAAPGAAEHDRTLNPEPRIPDPGSPIPGAVTSDRPQSAAIVRFRSCRWMQPIENGNTEFCTHREVKPYAGTAGFDAEAWCPECQYYKLRRTPKKRKPEDYTY